MMITVYIDVLFLVNFLMNILIFEGAEIITGETTGKARKAIAAVLGALVSCGMFFPSLSFLTGVATKACLSVAMVLCAYKIKSVKYFLKMTAAFYIASFVFAGGLTALLTMTDIGSKTGAIYSNGTWYFNLPWKYFILMCVCVYCLLSFVGRMRRRNITKKSAERDVEIFVKGECCVLKGIIDTGNSLFDPITGDPVIICEYDGLKNIIPKACGDVFDAVREAGLKMRAVPFSTVGKESGIMAGFCPDRVEIDKKCVKKCVVGISERKLFKDEDYHVLLNPDLIIN